MPKPLTEQERQAYLAEPHVGVVSVASDDGRPPTTVPIWYHYAPGGDLTFFTGSQSRKAKLIATAGRLSFVVQHDEVPYKYVTVEGSVIQADRPPTSEQLLTVVRRYLPEDEARAYVAAEEANGVDYTLYTIRPDRWLSLDFSEDG